MFSHMIASLKQGVLPSAVSIQGRLHIALIKKEAILRLPKSFQVSDPKMNPRADHMIWAAVILEDRNLFDITASILLTEKSCTEAETDSISSHNEQIIASNLANLLTTASHSLLRITLQSRILTISNYDLTCKSH